MEVQINSPPEVYGADYKNCPVVACVAADALSLPGNDLNAGSYSTNEGVWAGSCNLFTVMHGMTTKPDSCGVMKPTYQKDGVDQLYNVADYLAGSKILPTVTTSGVLARDIALEKGQALVQGPTH